MALSATGKLLLLTLCVAGVISTDKLPSDQASPPEVKESSSQAVPEASKGPETVEEVGNSRERRRVVVSPTDHLNWLLRRLSSSSYEVDPLRDSFVDPKRPFDLVVPIRPKEDRRQDERDQPNRWNVPQRVPERENVRQRVPERGNVGQRVPIRDREPLPLREFVRYREGLPESEFSQYTETQPARPPTSEKPPLPVKQNSVPSSELLRWFQEQKPLDEDLPPVLVQGNDYRLYRLRREDPQGAPRGALHGAPQWARLPAPTCAVPLPLPVKVLPPPPPQEAGGRTQRPLRGSRRRSRQSGGPPATISGAVSPSVPVFPRSLAIRGRLTLPRASYTEFYNASWHAESGSMRVDFYGGATSVFRSVNESKIYRLEKGLDRTKSKAFIRCTAMTQDPDSATAFDLAPPALPNLQLFQFTGYVDINNVRAERWEYTAAGGAGERGGANGEALTAYHEALLVRNGDVVTPLQYSVNVTSSTLGPDADGYIHYYDEVRELEPPVELLRPDLGACEILESTAELARVDPLREFTLPFRDPRHDDAFTSFISTYGSQYQDEVEEAVRKNVVMQSTRLSAAGNRVGATFKLGTTVLSDRMRKEVSRITGAAPGSPLGGDEFPHTKGEIRRMHDSLPAEFDYRKEGGVTHVKYQRSCSCCWAFSTVASVETALFKRTGTLVPLSEQVLVDCGHRYGTNGCEPSWPASAFDYIRSRGLPASSNYTKYMAKKQSCNDRSVPIVTYIDRYVKLEKNDLQSVKVAIREYAPVVVTISLRADTFKDYKTGVYYDDRCSSAPDAHAMTAVGFGSAQDFEYLILKNSHSSAWGEQGFMNIYAHNNTCGVLDDPIYPVLTDANVQLNTI